MTIIAWDGKMLAADKRSVNSGLARTVTKIHRISRFLVGASGSFDSTVEALAWVERGRHTDDYPKSQYDKDDYAVVFVIEPHTDFVFVYERSPYPLRFEDRFFAMGSGRDVALAAMHCGKTAKEAVEIACLFECSCGNGIDTLTL